MSTGPPDDLVRALVDGPGVLSGLEWHEAVESTQQLGAEAVERGVAEVHAVLADVQRAGRGRRGRTWTAPAGTSLIGSYVLRPLDTAGVAVTDLPLLPLLAGLALAETVAAHLPGVDVAVKWPNDLLVAGAKAAGVLTETQPAPGVGAAGPTTAVVLGVGCNVDWRGVDRPAGLAGATSLAEHAGAAVDRWRVLAGFVGVFGNRYRDWLADPRAFLPDYRRRCRTIGRPVRVERGEAVSLVGTATAVRDDGALIVDTGQGATAASAGDVVHLRTTD